jgi:hypothetical protein
MLGTDSGSHPDTRVETKLAPAFGVASPTQKALLWGQVLGRGSGFGVRSVRFKERDGHQFSMVKGVDDDQANADSHPAEILARSLSRQRHIPR